MTTRSTDINRTLDAELGVSLRVIAADILYLGSAIGDDGNGHARPLQAGDRFLGFVAAQCDNSAGAAGAKRVKRYRKGFVELAISGASQDDIGKSVYASDDDTFTLTESTNSYIGRVEDYVDSSTLLVAFDAGRAGLGTLAELTGSAVGTANGAMEAVTSPTAITGTEGGTANGAWEDTSTAVGQTANAGSADKADVDARLASIANNFAEVEAFQVQTTAAVSAIANNIEEVRARLDGLLRMLK